MTTATPVQMVAAANRIVGHATVIDGDSLAVAGARIRLLGIDAPEGAQFCSKDGRPWLCGQRAALALDEKIAKGVVACELRNRDRFGDVVAVCRLGGEDLGAWMVVQGWALASRRQSSAYVDLELAAARHGRGIWQGSFTPAWIWRQKEERVLAPVTAILPSPSKAIGPPIRLTPLPSKAR